MQELLNRGEWRRCMNETWNGALSQQNLLSICKFVKAVADLKGFNSILDLK